MNKGYILKKSKLLEILEFLASHTIKFRKQIGLTGGIIYKIKQWFINKNKINLKTFSKDDLIEVEEFFIKTNDYLKNLKQKYKND